MEDELKPCPFCGKIPEIVEQKSGSYQGMFALIHRCPVVSFGEMVYYSEESAINKWNTRVTDTKERT